MDAITRDERGLQIPLRFPSQARRVVTSPRKAFGLRKTLNRALMLVVCCHLHCDRGHQALQVLSCPAIRFGPSSPAELFGDDDPRESRKRWQPRAGLTQSHQVHERPVSPWLVHSEGLVAARRVWCIQRAVNGVVDLCPQGKAGSAARARNSGYAQVETGSGGSERRGRGEDLRVKRTTFHAKVTRNLDRR